MKLLFVVILSFIPIQTKLIGGIEKYQFKLQHSNIQLEQVNPEFKKFRDDMKFRESSNRSDTINKYGYIGFYQFGKAALEITGFGYITVDSFRQRPQIFPADSQEIAFKRLISINSVLLQFCIKKYNGKIVRGHKITKSGILAAAHLSGARKVKKWFNEGYIAKDKFGTTIENYLIKFSGYF